MTLHLIVMLWMVGLVFPALAESTIPINDPVVLREALLRDGRQGTANKVWQQLAPDGFGGSDYDKVLSHIETGDEKWLNVADALLCCVDASTGESLSQALIMALVQAPEVMLARTDINALGDVCTVPFIESSKTEFYNHIKAVKKALKRVKAPELLSKKAECRRLIDDIRWHNQ